MPSTQEVLNTADSNYHMHSREAHYHKSSSRYAVVKILDPRLRGDGMQRSSLDKATSEKVTKLLRQYYILRTQFNDQEVPVCSL